jgi:hypothetical protein
VPPIRVVGKMTSVGPGSVPCRFNTTRFAFRGGTKPMTRSLALAVLCGLVASTGCTQLRHSTQSAGGTLPSSIATSQNAPRPEIMRAGYHTPAVGVMDMPASPGYGRGCGVMGSGGHQLVNGCVDAVLDCPGHGCGAACGFGPGCGPGCGPGGCFEGCTCGGLGHCAACKAHRMHCMAAAMANNVLDPRACMSDAAYNFNPGPPTGQVAYPYYTTRGPRDFLCGNPASIGPR